MVSDQGGLEHEVPGRLRLLQIRPIHPEWFNKIVSGSNHR